MPKEDNLTGPEQMAQRSLQEADVDTDLRLEIERGIWKVDTDKLLLIKGIIDL